MKPRTAAIVIPILALILAIIWRIASQGSDNIVVQPASASVSFENMLEEVDEEQLRWMREEGDL